MTVTNWILLSALIIIIVFLIVSYALKKKILMKCCECLVIPVFGALNVLLLRNYLPDSLHLIKVSITALSLLTVSTIFISFESKKILRILGRLISLSSIICWIYLYKVIFYIHRVPLWLIISMSALYLACIIITIILSGKQNLQFYGLFALSFTLSSYLHFCSLIFLCYEKSSSSILLFSGATLYLILHAFHFINQAKLQFKHAGVIRFCLISASQILIACSNLMMIS